MTENLPVSSSNSFIFIILNSIFISIGSCKLTHGRTCLLYPPITELKTDSSKRQKDVFRGTAPDARKSNDRKKGRRVHIFTQCFSLPQLTVDEEVGAFMYSLSELLMSSIITSEVLRWQKVQEVNYPVFSTLYRAKNRWNNRCVFPMTIRIKLPLITKQGWICI